jgi:hypothetical protein
MTFKNRPVGLSPPYRSWLITAAYYHGVSSWKEEHPLKDEPHKDEPHVE